MKKIIDYSVCLGLYTTQNNTNYQNEQKQLTITGTKWEEIKRGTKVKRHMKGEQWQGQGNFATLQNFTALQNFCSPCEIVAAPVSSTLFFSFLLVSELQL